MITLRAAVAVAASFVMVGCAALSPPDDASVPAPDPAALELDASTQACLRPPVVRETFASITESGTTTHYRLAPKPRGVLVALHGSGGSSSSLVASSVEWASFFHEAALRDYVIVVPESLERAPPRQWDAQSENGDTPHIASLLDRLQLQAGLPAELPIFIVGMSNGGGAAPIVALRLAKEGRRVRAVGVYCAGASSVFERPDYELPTTFSLMANDSVMTKNARVTSITKALVARGVDAEVAVEPPSALCPEAFTRIPGIDADASHAIASELRAAGVLGADGRVTFSLEQDVAALVPSHPSFARQIEEQLRIAAAEHTFFDARTRATLAFFEAHRNE